MVLLSTCAHSCLKTPGDLKWSGKARGLQYFTSTNETFTWPGRAYDVDVSRGASVALCEVGQVANGRVKEAPLGKKVEIRVHGQQRVLIVVETAPNAACLARHILKQPVRLGITPTCKGHRS
jgi:hypothetical protein